MFGCGRSVCPVNHLFFKLLHLFVILIMYLLIYQYNNMLMYNNIINTYYIVVLIHIVAGRRSVVRKQRKNCNNKDV